MGKVRWSTRVYSLLQDLHSINTATTPLFCTLVLLLRLLILVIFLIIACLPLSGTYTMHGSVYLVPRLEEGEDLVVYVHKGFESSSLGMR